MEGCTQGCKPELDLAKIPSKLISHLWGKRLRTENTGML